LILKKLITSRFSKNFIWLFLLNNLGYLFSFLTLPILISKYGLKETGVIFTVQSLVFAISAIANYSFVYYIPTLSKQISNHAAQFSKLWSLAIHVRLLLSILLGVISTLFVYLYFHSYLTIWLFSLSLLLSKIINPTLFFNALELNKYLFKIGFFTKLSFLILVYFTDNSNLVNLFLGTSEFLATLFFLKKASVFSSKISFVSLKKIMLFLQKTFNLFLVNFVSLSRTASILPAISFFLGSEFAALYTLSDKIINMIRSVSGAMFVSFFPIYNKEKVTFQFFSIRNLFLIISLSLIAIATIWILSPYLIYYLNNLEENKIATKTLQILSLSIPMFFLIIPLFSYLLELKKGNAILLFASIQLAVLFILIFNYHQNINQIAISVVITEYIYLACYYAYILRLKYLKTTF